MIKSQDCFDDGVELTNLLSNSKATKSILHPSRWIRALYIGTAVVVVELLISYFPKFTIQKLDPKESDVHQHVHQLILQCQKAQLSTVNFDEEVFRDDYLSEGSQPIEENFLETFRESKFDAWGRSFETIKQGLTQWRIHQFVPYLHSGSSIFESACGIGLNLYLTVEIMQEQANISSIAVYGNEYLEENAERANQILQLLLDTQEGVSDDSRNKLGGICQGDSANLSFVPENAFDVVFTGYMNPLWDPLELGLDFMENYEEMKRICNSAKYGSDDDQKSENEKLVRIMQEKQEEWFSNWFKQMIRIAKPGAPVIVEDVAPPYCEADDWGGVNKEFWKAGVKKFAWQVDQDSLVFGESAVSKHRYHVFMRKVQGE